MPGLAEAGAFVEEEFAAAVSAAASTAAGE